MSDKEQTPIVDNEEVDCSDAVVYPCDTINVATAKDENGRFMVGLIFGHKGGRKAAFPISLEVAEAVYSKLGGIIKYMRQQRTIREGFSEH